MGKIVLIGEREAKRTKFFLLAAKDIGERVYFMDIHKIEKEKLQNSIVKIDPMIMKEIELEQLNLVVSQYRERILSLEGIKDIKFLNSPRSILAMLDKRKSKNILLNSNIATTPLLGDNIKNINELKQVMEEKKIYSVFIKPVFGSGAAGVVAYRYNAKLNKEIVITSIVRKEDKLINTKKIIKYTDSEEIEKILGNILLQDAIVEKWIPKAEYKGFHYDIRAVCQFNQVDFMVGRGSSQPITNLHLNNNAIVMGELNISPKIIDQIHTLCKNAISYFSGAQTVGIDILLAKDSLTPYIIEMNGQGDLLYQDIYKENKVYKRQIQEMRRQIDQ